MSSQSPSKTQLWAGRVVSAIAVLGLGMSSIMKLTANPQMVQGFVEKLGYPGNVLTTIGLVELVATILYAIPKTTVLGAILLTGHLGGAIATHVRISDPFVAPVVLGILVWAGLFLRDERVRALLPLRAST